MMKLLVDLFFMFVKLAAFSFGGGYVMIPIMIQELEAHGWATAADVTDVVAIAGMCPGPVAVNASVGVGYKVAGVPGVIAAFLGIAIPCTIIVILVAMFFFKVYNSKIVQNALYGLRPVVTGIILYAAVKLALANGILYGDSGTAIKSGWNIVYSGTHLLEIKSLLIAVIAFLLLMKTKTHPIFIIIGSGVLGVLIF